MDDLLTLRAAAAELGISRARLHKLVKDGRASPAVKHERLILLSRAEVERLRATPRPPGRPRTVAITPPSAHTP